MVSFGQEVGQMPYKDPEARRVSRRAYYARNKDRVKAANKASNERHPDRVRETNRKWRENNKDRQRETWRAWVNRNQERYRRSRNEWQRRNKKKMLGYSRRYRFGIEPEHFDAILALQGNVCPGCLRNESEAGTLCVDHCHSTGVIRGMLCSGCNLSLGNADEDPDRLERLARYIRSRQTKGESNGRQSV